MEPEQGTNQNLKKVALVVGAIAIVIVAGYLLFRTSHTAPQSAAEPARTDYGTSLPAGFPSDIPIEKGAVLSQSYTLDYGTQKQLSVTFPSTKTVADNYARYDTYLGKTGWAIMDKQESDSVAALYALRANNELSAVIIPGQVTLSILVLSSDQSGEPDATTTRMMQAMMQAQYGLSSSTAPVITTTP